MHPITTLPSTDPAASSLTLYFSPLACSLASRIACYEAGVDIAYAEVDPKTKKMAAGGDFFAINPMGQVPVLELDGSVHLSENTAVLQYLIDRFPEADLGPRDGFARSRLQQWLGFIGTELHKAVFVPLLDPKLDPAVRAYAQDKAKLRLDVLERHLFGQDHLLDRYSVADAYCVTVLNWAPYAGIDLARWPAVKAYYARIASRPAVARALAEEFALWKAEQRRAA